MPATANPRRADDIRQHNLGLLLSELHRDGELTRAELTQRLGLSRSTIGVLVNDLAELGLVSAQVPTGGERAGRPSHVVGLREEGPYVIAVDVDVSHVCVAAVGLGGRVLGRKDVPLRERTTPKALISVVLRTMAQLQAQVRPEAAPIGIGVSIPGTVTPDGTIVFAPNLGWRNVRFGALLQTALPSSLPVQLGNDADVSVLAEHRRGAGRDCNDLVFMLGRVGVGAGMIVNGRPLIGHGGGAGEIGHNVMDPSGPVCRCGKRGCVETYVGDSALLQRVPGASNAAEVFARAASGDPTAEAAVREVACWLGRILANIVNVLVPERVILGGSLTGVLNVAHDDVVESLQANVFEHVAPDLLLIPPGLGEDSALLGAAELAFAGLLEDPLLLR